jgi:tetratricopeptide (TPR) repeat protein
MYYYRAVIYLFLGMNSEALEDIDRAIEKSEDNVARYFHARGILFMLDKNYEQASSEFATALSIDENA